MKSCFNSKMIITQKFGNKYIYQGKDFYAQYGLKGHNGLDVVPENKKDSSIFNFMPGEIVLLAFNECYGNRIGIWNHDLNLFECHNHLENWNKKLYIGQKISARMYIGDMGNTGKSHGWHNHIGICQVNILCRRINYDNGFLGWLDPIETLAKYYLI